MLRVLFLLSVLFAADPATAQDASPPRLVATTLEHVEPATSDGPPSLTEAQVLQLRVYELAAENLALKLALLQVEAQRNQSDANAFAATLQRDGYQLQRGEDGQWRYVETPKEPTK